MWVVQTAFLGDCVLSLPFISRALDLFPKEDLQIITGHPGMPLFKLAFERGLKNQAHRIRLWQLEKRSKHAYPWGLYSFAKEIRKIEKPSKVFCLQRSFRSGFLSLISGAPKRYGFSSGAASFFYSDLCRRDWNTGRPEIEKNLDLLRCALGQEVEPWSPSKSPSFLSPPDWPGVDLNSESVAVSLGSPWPTKRWPVKNSIDLIERLTREGLEVKLLGDKSAIPLADEIRAKVPSLLLKDLCGKTTIKEMVDEIATSRLLVSGDSAAVHVASDLGVPVIALFGPTLPDFGFAPWRKNSVALGISNLKCRPCDIHGPKKCPEVHHRCLVDLSGETVHKQLRKMIVKPESLE